MKSENAADAAAAHLGQPIGNETTVPDSADIINRLTIRWGELLDEAAPAELLKNAVAIYDADAVVEAMLELCRSPLQHQYTSDADLFLGLVRSRYQMRVIAEEFDA